MKMLDLFIAECLKIKSSLTLYFSLIISALIVSLVFVGHNLDVHSLASLNQNPWNLYFNRAHCILTAFMTGPICIFLILSFFFLERRADSQKLLFTFPNSRMQLSLMKAILILLLLFWIFSSFVFITAGSGYVLNWIFPEYELTYYSPPISESLSLMFHTFINCLGIVGIQILLHTLFRSYLIPLGIGFLAFISGFILATLNLSMTKFHPYSYPVIVRDLNFIASDYRELYYDGWFSNLELYSLIIFIVCIAMSMIIESNKLVK